MARGVLESDRDSLATMAQEIRAQNTAAVQLKMRLLGEARTKLAQNQVAEDIINAAGTAAADHFHQEQQRLTGEADHIPPVDDCWDGNESCDGVDEWELLDGIELGDCGQKAVERAQALGVTNAEILRLFLDFGMRMADFCFAQEVQQLPV